MTFNGDTYTDTKTESIEATGHSYGTPTFTWSGTKCVATFKCTAGDDTQTKDCLISLETTKAATCAEKGEKRYTATVTFNGKTYSTTKTETIAKLAHTYKTTTTKAKPGANGKTVTKCSVCGAVKSTTMIYAPKTVTLSKTSYTYSGKSKNPTITVKDSKGKKIASSNYTVSYPSGRKSVGKHSVKITFKGTKYSGTLTTSFSINPKATKIKKASNLTRGIKVTWSKTSNITGYQIQYSTSKTFKNAKTVTASKSATSKKITGLSTGSMYKKYYVRIRTYKTVSGKKYYSTWSATQYAYAVRYSK